MKKFLTFLLAFSLCLTVFGTYGFESPVVCTDESCDEHNHAGHVLLAADTADYLTATVTSQQYNEKQGTFTVLIYIELLSESKISGGTVTIRTEGSVLKNPKLSSMSYLFGELISEDEITTSSSGTYTYFTVKIPEKGEDTRSSYGSISIVYSVDSEYLDLVSSLRAQTLTVSGSVKKADGTTMVFYPSPSSLKAYVCNHNNIVTKIIKQPTCQDAGIVMVSAYAVHPDVVNAGEYVFSQSFPGAVQATAAATFAVEDLGAQRIAIVAVDLDFGKEQSAYFKAKAAELGAEIVSEDYIAMSDNDMTSVVSKIKNENVDLIYMPNYYAHASEVCRQVALQGLDVDILGCEGADSWQLLLTAGEYAEGLYITTNMDRDDPNESTQAYIENYRAEYDMEPDMVGASVYDAFEVLFAAMKEVGTDPAAMQEYIAAMKDFDTVTGTLMYYTSAGSAVKPVQIQQVGEDLQFHSYSVIDDIQIIDGDNIPVVEY